jgi:hypothetical protein
MGRSGNTNADMAPGQSTTAGFVGYPLGHPTDECPECGSPQMCWVTNQALESCYLCEACGRCWKLSAEGATRVTPLSCPGCQHADVCFEQIRAEIPPFWAPVEE